MVVLLIRAIIVTSAIVSLRTAATNELDTKYATGVPLCAWDSKHYSRILTEGYSADQIEPLIAFFPEYPLLAWPLAQVTSPELALLIVANACSVIGLILLFQWARGVVGERMAFTAPVLAAAFPPAMFFSAAYVQGPMLLMVSLALLFMQRSQWFGAGLASGFATALHPTGVAVAMMVGIAMWVSRVRWTTMAPVMVISVGGLLAYQGFLWARYDRFDAYLQAQSAWSVTEDDGASGRSDGPPASTQVDSNSSRWIDSLPAPLQKLTSLGAWNKLWLLVILALTVVGFIRPGPIPRALFVLPLVIFLLGYLPGKGARVTSIARLETVAAPCFVLAALLLGRWWRISIAIVVVLVIMQAWYAFAFSRGEWAG